jgi:AAA domain
MPNEPVEKLGEKPAKIALPFTSVATWHGTVVPEREWTVLNRVPAKNVTLMSGDGGVGKTILALHLCAARSRLVAIGWARCRNTVRPWDSVARMIPTNCTGASP